MVAVPIFARQGGMRPIEWAGLRHFLRLGRDYARDSAEVLPHILERIELLDEDMATG